MIRDPSDGSVKVQPKPEMSAGRLKERYGENWGLKSLDRKPKASTFKPMNPEQLAEHCSKFDIGRKPKENT